MRSSPRALAVCEHPARGAFVAYLAFVVAVYASLSQLVPALAPLAPGQTLIALAAGALLWAVLLGGRRLRLGLGAGGGALYLFFGVLVASPLWSLWPRLSLQAVAESAKYLTAFFVAANLLDSRERVRWAATVLALATLVPAVGAIESWFAGEHLVEGTRAAWIGVFGNPNFLAYHLVVAVPIALALREGTRGPRAAWRRAGWLAAIGLYAVAILLSGSRGGTVGLAAVVLLWLVRGLARGRLAVGAAAAIGIAITMTPVGPWNRAETAATLAGEVDASAQGRIDAWRTAERIIERRPFTGVGAGAFVLGYDLYAPGDAGPARTAHNSFLLIAAELGLIALTLFAAALLLSYRALGRIAERAAPEASLARGVQTAIFGFVVCSLTGGYAFTWPLYFLLGLAAGLVAVAEEPSPR